MDVQEPTMRTMKISVVKNTLSSLVNTVYRERTRILIEKNGIPVAVLISAEDFRRLTRFEQEREERFAVIDQMREAFKDVPPEEIEWDTDRIIAGIRAENRERGREKLFNAIDRMREAFKDVPDEEIEREADRAVAELRNKIPAPV